MSGIAVFRVMAIGCLVILGIYIYSVSKQVVFIAGNEETTFAAVNPLLWVALAISGLLTLGAFVWRPK